MSFGRRARQPLSHYIRKIPAQRARALLALQSTEIAQPATLTIDTIFPTLKSRNISRYGRRTFSGEYAAAAAAGAF